MARGSAMLLSGSLSRDAAAAELHTECHCSLTTSRRLDFAFRSVYAGSFRLQLNNVGFWVRFYSIDPDSKALKGWLVGALPC